MDWHRRRPGQDEPRCSNKQWRTRERDVVVTISKMGDWHLADCIRFAETRAQHASRLEALQAEQRTRANDTRTQ